MHGWPQFAVVACGGARKNDFHPNSSYRRYNKPPTLFSHYTPPLLAIKPGANQSRKHRFYPRTGARYIYPAPQISPSPKTTHKPNQENDLRKKHFVNSNPKICIHGVSPYHKTTYANFPAHRTPLRPQPIIIYVNPNHKATYGHTPRSKTLVKNIMHARKTLQTPRIVKLQKL